MTVYNIEKDNLLAFNQHRACTTVEGVCAGGSANADPLLRGTLLGRVTATGMLVPCDKTAVDGSQVPFAVLAEDCEIAGATTGARASIYTDGVFNKDALVFAAGNTAADHYLKARENGLILSKNAE